METFYAVLGLCVLLLLLVKAWQVWRLYGSRLRMSLEPLPPVPEDFEQRNPELPGKVRVIPRAQTEEPVVDSAPALAPSRPSLKQRMSALLDEDAPARPLQEEALSAPPLFERQAETMASEPVLSDLVQSPPSVASAPLLFAPEPAPASPAPAVADGDEPPVLSPSLASSVPPSAKPAVEQHDMFAADAVQPRAEPSLAMRASALYEKEPLEPVNVLGNAPEKNSVPQEEIQDVVAVHVICRGVPFNGEDLLRAILSYGLRFGEMSIFHRHEQPTGQGRVLFSMAKAVEPGTFELETMTGDFVPGVSFFQSLPGVNSILAYDIMIDTAKRLATELNGEILDQQQNPMTRQLIEHYRERVMEFERRRLAARR